MPSSRPPRRSATRTGITSSRSGRPGRDSCPSVPGRMPMTCDRPVSPTSRCRSGSSAGRSSWRRAAVVPVARRCPPCCSARRRAMRRWPSCPTAVRSWPWPSRAPTSRGVSCTSSARPADRWAAATSRSRGWRPMRWVPSSAAPSVPRRWRTCSTARRPCAGWPATSAAGSTSTGSWPAWSTMRWSCSRAIARRCSSSARMAMPWSR